MSKLARRVHVYSHVHCRWEWIWVVKSVAAFTGIGLCAGVLIHGGGHGWFDFPPIAAQSPPAVYAGPPARREAGVGGLPVVYRLTPQDRPLGVPETIPAPGVGTFAIPLVLLVIMRALGGRS